MRETIPFRPRPTPPFSVLRRVHDGPPVTIRLPSSGAGPTETNTLLNEDRDALIIMRAWTAEGARACTLCRSGCNAQIGRGGEASCIVWAPPETPASEAAGFRCDHPSAHYVEKPARRVEYAKPRGDAAEGARR